MGYGNSDGRRMDARMSSILETDGDGHGTLFKTHGGHTESRAERTDRLERLGVMDPDCTNLACRQRYEAADPPWSSRPATRRAPYARAAGIHTAPAAPASDGA